MKVITFKIEDSIWQETEQILVKNGMSRDGYINEAIESLKILKEFERLE